MIDETDNDLFIRQIQDYAIFRIDPEGIICSWNEGVERIFGYGEEEWVGSSSAIIFTPEDVGQRHPGRELETARRHGIANDDRWHVHKNGTRFWANGSMNAVRDPQGGIAGFVKVVQDRTRERAAADALRRAHLQLGAAVEAGGVITWFWDIPNDRLTGNPALAHLFAIDEQDAEKGLPLERFLAAVAVADRGRVEAALWSAVETGAPFAEEYRVHDSRGNEHWVTVRGRPEYDEEGSPHYLPGVLIDISEQKENEKLLRDLNDLLNKEFETLNYSVSHDLRSPLRSIHGFAQVLQEDYSDALGEEGRDHLERISTAASRMGEVMDALVELARIPRLELEPRTVKLSELARQVGAELQSSYSRKVELRIQPNLEAWGDRQLLRQALHYLLDNAFRYSQEAARPLVEVGGTSSNALDAFFVSDNGSGFNVRHASRIFEPFHRLDATTEEEEGLGVGLALTQQIVTKHGGVIWAEGAPGEGVTIYFTLELGGAPPGTRPGHRS